MLKAKFKTFLEFPVKHTIFVREKWLVEVLHETQNSLASVTLIFMFCVGTDYCLQ